MNHWPGCGVVSTEMNAERSLKAKGWCDIQTKWTGVLWYAFLWVQAASHDTNRTGD